MWHHTQVCRYLQCTFVSHSCTCISKIDLMDFVSLTYFVMNHFKRKSLKMWIPYKQGIVGCFGSKSRLEPTIQITLSFTRTFTFKFENIQCFQIAPIFNFPVSFGLFFNSIKYLDLRKNSFKDISRNLMKPSTVFIWQSNWKKNLLVWRQLIVYWNMIWLFAP